MPAGKRSLEESARPEPTAAERGVGAVRDGPYCPWRQVIAVTSGKGGVGKSNLAASLSVLLSASGARVALVDADIGLGNLDVLMGVNGAPTLADVAAGQKLLEEVLVELPCGVHLAAGCTGPVAGNGSYALWRSALLEGIDRIRRRYAFVVLDCGSGIGTEVMDFCAAADQVLVVTAPEPTAMTDAYAVIKSLSLRGLRARVSVLVNFASGREEAKACQARLASVAGQFLGRTIYDAGYVVADSKVVSAVKGRRPFVLAYPRCPASRCLTALASKMCPGSPLLNQKKTGLIGRIARWLR
jgi:flagellar biosynthesis protein FlhG